MRDVNWWFRWIVLCVASGCGDDGSASGSTGTASSGASTSSTEGVDAGVDATGPGGTVGTSPATVGSGDGTTDASDTTDTGGPPPIEGDPCEALMLVFAEADCADPTQCEPIECVCGASFGACAQTQCVSGLDCDVLCALPTAQIQNCVDRVYDAPTQDCIDDFACRIGSCVSYLGQSTCRDDLPCVVDDQCSHHCADGKCAADPLPSCSDAARCDWACIDGSCTHGFAGSACNDSSECEANFCVRGLCSTGAPGEGCFGDSNCISADHCEMGICVGLDLGAPCVDDDQCTAGFCVDDICTDGHRGAPCSGFTDCISLDCDAASGTCL